MILKTFAEYPARKRVGIFGILLGVISIFLGSPFDKVNTSINAKEMAMISVDDISNVNVNKLADDIIKSKYDYRLIDLRNTEDYAKYNIPSSENIQVDQILNSDLARNENILLYSDNDIQSTQAWFLLKSNNYKGINVLKGGLSAWQEDILFPKCVCGENSSVEQKHKHDKLAKVSEFFGGKIQSSSSATIKEKMDMPTLNAPKKVTLKKAKGKRKREGC